jgi:hypothetical protein
MKTIYLAIMQQLETVEALKWIDLDTGQLSQAKPSVAFPCALVSIKLPKCKSLTDKIQDCEARISVRLGFDSKMRTAAKTPEAARTLSLAVYDTIADVYKALQGFGTENFDSLNRVSQGDEPSKNGVFIYKQEFSSQFEDRSAEEE